MRSLPIVARAAIRTQSRVVILFATLFCNVAAAAITVDTNALTVPAGQASITLYRADGTQVARFSGARTLALGDGNYFVAAYGGSAVFGSFSVAGDLVTSASGGLAQTGAQSIAADTAQLTRVELSAAGLSEPAGQVTVRLSAGWEGGLSVFNGALTSFLPDGAYRISTYAGTGEFGSFIISGGAVASAAGHLAADGTRLHFVTTSLAPVRFTSFSQPAGLQLVRVSDPYEGVAVVPNGDGLLYLPQGRYRVTNYETTRSYGSFDVVGTQVTAASGAFAAASGHLALAECGLPVVDIATSGRHALVACASGIFASAARLVLPPGEYVLQQPSSLRLASFVVTASGEVEVGQAEPGVTISVAPCIQDGDADGIADVADNCPDVANPEQVDQDLDGAGNDCDDDRDGDGAPNAADVCPDIVDAQQDSDSDGVGDLCDDDRDGDSVNDVNDNCVNLANPSQADADADAQGDPCDGDDDDDLVEDAQDNCGFIPNAGQHDLDGDGEGDVCDADGDGDGVANLTDSCPSTSLGQPTGADGCSGEELLARSCVVGSFSKHGHYVSCVARASADAVKSGIITEQERARWVSSAARSR